MSSPYQFLFVFVFFLVGSLAVNDSAQAQLFGDRSSRIGTPLSRQSGSGALIQGGERFLRSNRSQRSFVGSDTSEQTTFVGMQEGSTSGNVVTTTSTLPPMPNRAATLNQAFQPSSRIYDPKLIIAFEVPATSSQIEINARERTREKEILKVLAPIQSNNNQSVSIRLKNRVAILSGEVRSEKAKRIAGLMLSFEPGVGQVVNELVVR